MPDSAPVGRCRVFVAIRHAVPATHYSHTSVRDLQISHRAVVAAEVAINRRPSWQRRVIYVAELFIGLCKAGVSPPPHSLLKHVTNVGSLNMTLPAFAAERRLMQHSARSYRSPALSSKPVGRCYCCRSMGQTDALGRPTVT